ncbi:MAG: hypothetical protein RI985_2250 [Chloroflexota bacterium]|jgi:threonine/homoserine/homoserine lactone efflux protein
MLTLYIVSTTLLILAPGTNMVMMLALASSHGATAGRWAALGLACGVLLHTTLAATGGAVVMQQWPEALRWIQLAGGLYLVWLGGTMLYRQLFGQPSRGVATTTARVQTPFVQGVLSSITNTKTLVLFVSFLPQFMAPAQAIAPQFVVLGVIYAGLTLLIYGVIGSLAGWAGSWLQRPLVQRIMRGTAGVVIAGLGVWGIVGA